MNEKVRVTVNGRPSTFFLGMSVRHAIGAGAARLVEQGRAEVRNADGNSVGLDGALHDGETLFVRKHTAATQTRQASRATTESYDMRPDQALQGGGMTAAEGGRGESDGAGGQEGQTATQGAAGRGQQGHTKTPGPGKDRPPAQESTPPWGDSAPSGSGGGAARGGCAGVLAAGLSLAALLALIGVGIVQSLV